MARPRKKIDIDLLEKLASYNLPNNMIADCLGISQKTLERRFVDKIRIFNSKGKTKLAVALWQKAITKDYFPAQKLLASVLLSWNEKTTLLADDSMKPFSLAYSTQDLRKKPDETT